MLVTVQGQVCYSITYNNKDRLLADDTEVGHRVNDAEKSLNRLGLLTNHGLVNGQRQVVVVEVCLHLLAVDVEDVQVHDSKGTAPSLVAVGKLRVGGVENAVHEGEVIFDLLVTLDVEAGLGLGNGSFEV